MTPSGIEPATFRFVAQHLNHCATAVPTESRSYVKNKENYWLCLIGNIHFFLYACNLSMPQSKETIFYTTAYLDKDFCDINTRGLK